MTRLHDFGPHPIRQLNCVVLALRIRPIYGAFVEARGPSATIPSQTGLSFGDGKIGNPLKSTTLSMVCDYWNAHTGWRESSTGAYNLSRLHERRFITSSLLPSARLSSARSAASRI
jgi:hypothetical protein